MVAIPFSPNGEMVSWSVIMAYYMMSATVLTCNMTPRRNQDISLGPFLYVVVHEGPLSTLLSFSLLSWCNIDSIEYRLILWQLNMIQNKNAIIFWMPLMLSFIITIAITPDIIIFICIDIVIPIVFVIVIPIITVITYNYIVNIKWNRHILLYSKNAHMPCRMDQVVWFRFHLPSSFQRFGGWINMWPLCYCGWTVIVCTSTSHENAIR